MKDKKIETGLATEEQVNKKLIEVWHKTETEQDTIRTAEENLYLQVLRKYRIPLLQVLHSQGVSSIRRVSQLLNRNSKNVYQDVQLLKKAELIPKALKKGCMCLGTS